MAAYRKKLIEVALPLEAINKASAREKSIRHGHPSTLHLWWARRPLAACRAVLFASLVDDPDSDPAYRKPDGTADEERAGVKRAELFNLIEELVQWENSNDPLIIGAARAEIARCVASRKLETGELKKDHKLPGGETVWDLVVKGHGDLQHLRSGRVRLPSAESVNAFLAEHAPPVLDPFCGGGSIPLEAQRLGLRAFGSDLNPVPVLITKALIEIPPKFAGMPPVNPESRGEAGPAGKKGEGKGKSVFAKAEWSGAAGLAEDVRYYGRWMRDEAQKRIGHLYPKITVTEAMARDRADLKPHLGRELTVIAWLWARTVPSPNPAAAGAHVPLVRSFWLSTKEGKKAWVEPVIAPDGRSYKFEMRTGLPTKEEKKAIDAGTKTGRGCKFRCLLTNTPIPEDHIKEGARAGDMDSRLMAIVVEGVRGRVYLAPTSEQEMAAKAADSGDAARAIHAPIGNDPRALWCLLYGLDHFDDLFTARQLVALTTFSDLVMEARARVLADARSAGLALAEGVSKGGMTGTEIISAGTKEVLAGTKTPSVGTNGASEGTAATENRVSEAPDGATCYADSLATYLAFLVSRQANYSSSLCVWSSHAKDELAKQVFLRQGLPMTWDFAETNPFASSGGTFGSQVEWLSNAIPQVDAATPGAVSQANAIVATAGLSAPMICTDPPYYDNIGYSDLADFFYLWLRRSLGDLYPSLFRTLLTPKAEELIASPYRHDGSKSAAMGFFETGLGQAFSRMREKEHPDYPLTVFYAFKQAESEDAGGDEDSPAAASTASTGWETMLEGLIRAEFAITGTWPMRTELIGNLKNKINALATSVVLVCHPRGDSAPMASRREFVTALKRELPTALKGLQCGNIAPVDLAQAAIGPGMAVYSRYSKVLETSGDRMGVRTALALINQVLDEVLAEQEGEFDPDTRWALAWFEQHAYDEGAYGDAETLSKAKNVSVRGLEESGFLSARGGKVRLLRRDELDAHWDPAADARMAIWEVTQHLIRRLGEVGESGAADLLRKLGGVGEVARDLAYRLYTTCERKKWAQEALAYNSLVVAWPELCKLARSGPIRQPESQSDLFS